MGKTKRKFILLNISNLRWGGVQVRYILLVLVSLFLSLNSFAQNIAVTDFRLDISDLTANSTATQVLDQNGDKCALIRVQTTHKGFLFDVGSLGVQKVDEDHIGEIWVYVSYGTRHISIRHPQLGSLPYYDFPVSIQKARTYYLVITSDAVIAPTVNYNADRVQKLIVRSVPNAKVNLNGNVLECDAFGELVTTLSFGTYSYKIESKQYYPKEGQIIIENPDSAHELIVKDLEPRLGALSLKTNATNPTILLDGEKLTTQSENGNYPIIVGQHKIEISAKGYDDAKADFEISENEITTLELNLFKGAIFEINSKPKNVSVSVAGTNIGTTPIKRKFESGTYRVQAQKKRYVDFDQELVFDSENPVVDIKMFPKLNYKTQFYLQLGVQWGPSCPSGFVSTGIGVYVSNFNLELNCIPVGEGSSEMIYWQKNDERPDSYAQYSERLQFSVKLGYGFSFGRRLRITPQVGANLLLINDMSYYNAPIDGSYNTALTLGSNISFGLFNHFAIFAAPEYYIAGAIAQSAGYKALSGISPIIRSWNNGFFVRFGFNLFI